MTLLETLGDWSQKISPGGYWTYGSGDGVRALNLLNARSDVSTIVGFRPEELAHLVVDAEAAPALRAENARLREALKYYADPNHWEDCNEDGRAMIDWDDEDFDRCRLSRLSCRRWNPSPSNTCRKGE